MTLPTPTAAPEAPPLPHRGEGMGVGGHFRRLRIHGAPWLAVTLALTTPTHAQVIPTGSPAADILLSQAIAEHRVFLTCSALDHETHARIRADWQADVASATAILASHNVPPETVAAFTTAADPAALLPTEDTPWAEVQGLCATRPDWLQAYDSLDRVILDLKLVGVLE